MVVFGNMNKETCKGLQGVDLTTAGHLFDPALSFRIANELNAGKPKAEWMLLELYPTLDRKLLILMRMVSEKFGLHLPLPKGVTSEQVQQWQDQYPDTKVARVHLPFSYNTRELWHRIFIGERKNGLKQQAFQIMWMLYFGAATNRKGIELAQQLGSGVTAHPNVVEGFAKDGKLDELKGSVAFVLAENERRYISPILRNQESIADPLLVIQNIVKKYRLKGLLLGVDHGYEEGFDMEKMLADPDIQEYTVAMHLAKPRSQAHHDIIGVGDPEFERFLHQAAQTQFRHPVRAALDYNPFILSKLSFPEQLKLFRETIDWIRNRQ